MKYIALEKGLWYNQTMTLPSPSSISQRKLILDSQDIQESVRNLGIDKNSTPVLSDKEKQDKLEQIGFVFETPRFKLSKEITLQDLLKDFPIEKKDRDLVEDMLTALTTQNFTRPPYVDAQGNTDDAIKESFREAVDTDIRSWFQSINKMSTGAINKLIIPLQKLGSSEEKRKASRFTHQVGGTYFHRASLDEKKKLCEDVSTTAYTWLCKIHPPIASHLQDTNLQETIKDHVSQAMEQDSLKSDTEIQQDLCDKGFVFEQLVFKNEDLPDGIVTDDDFVNDCIEEAEAFLLSQIFVTHIAKDPSIVSEAFNQLHSQEIEYLKNIRPSQEELIEITQTLTLLAMEISPPDKQLSQKIARYTQDLKYTYESASLSEKGSIIAKAHHLTLEVLQALSQQFTHTPPEEKY